MTNPIRLAQQLAALAFLAALLLVPGLAGAARPPLPPLYTCSGSGPGVQLRQADLTPAVRAALHAQVPFPMADAGRPWNATDLVEDESLPFKRLICAYPDGDDFVVQYEYGGFARGAAWFVVPGAAHAPQ